MTFDSGAPAPQILDLISAWERLGDGPRVLPHVLVEIVAPDSVLLLSEARQVALRGRLYSELLPLLDGRHALPAIIAALRDKAPAVAIMVALARLERAGVVVGGAQQLPAEQEAFWALAGVDPRALAARLKSARVAVRAVSAIDPQPLVAELERLGISAGGPSQTPDARRALTIVLTDDYLDPALDKLNRAFLEQRQPWMLVKPVGASVWVGPLFEPDRTGCWQCLAQRLRTNRLAELTLMRASGREHTALARGALPASRATAFGLAALETAKWLALAGRKKGHADDWPRALRSSAGTPKSLAGRMISFDLLTLALSEHRLTRRPQCPSCGDVRQGAQGGRAIALTSQPKRSLIGGGHRCCPPSETVARLSRHVSPITGIVSRLERQPSPDDELIHYYASTFSLEVPEDVADLRSVLRPRGNGKGISDVQARASALCESLERHCGLFAPGVEQVTHGRYVDLARDAVHPGALLLFSDSQYRLREEWNSRAPLRYHVPRSFDETASIDWTQVWSLTHARPRLVPTAFCYFGCPVAPEKRFCVADSNGHAAGNCLEEAILHGFLELVERDSVALWWYNRLSCPTVDLDSFAEPYLARLREAYRLRKRELWVLDLTFDLGVPTFAALARRTDGPPASITMGFGAHLDPDVALLRAVTELSQCTCQCSGFGPDPAIHADDPVQDAWLREATLASEPFLNGAQGRTASRRNDYRDLSSPDLRDDVLTCVAIARDAGLETLVLDQTRPDVELCAVKVCVPGLRHCWHRLAPGRLFDVPVRLGLLKAPLCETDLNPRPMIL